MSVHSSTILFQTKDPLNHPVSTKKYRKIANLGQKVKSPDWTVELSVMLGIPRLRNHNATDDT